MPTPKREDALHVVAFRSAIICCSEHASLLVGLGAPIPFQS